MPGTPTWKPVEIAYVRAASRAKEPKLSDEEIATKFNSRFPSHQVTASSVSYCKTHYVDREEYNPKIWLGNFPGKKGYVLGLFAHGFQQDEIIRRIEHRYSSHEWPGTERTNENQTITKREAVDIAIATYNEYAPFYGQTSLLRKYPNPGEASTRQVLERHRLGFFPDIIRQHIVPPMEYDDVIFILTRFVDGFADRYLNDTQVVGNVMLLGSELLPASVPVVNAPRPGQMSSTR